MSKKDRILIWPKNKVVLCISGDPIPFYRVNRGTYQQAVIARATFNLEEDKQDEAEFSLLNEELLQYLDEAYLLTPGILYLRTNSGMVFGVLANKPQINEFMALVNIAEYDPVEDKVYMHLSKIAVEEASGYKTRRMIHHKSGSQIL